MSDLNKAKGYSNEYLKTDEELRSDIIKFHKNSSLINVFKFPMITCELRGGIGNQMFMIATTFAHAKKYNYIPFFKYYNKVDKTEKYKKSIFSHVPFQEDIDTTNFERYNESLKQVYSDIPSISKNHLLFGYFQSSKYFSEIKPHLCKIFDSRSIESDTFLKELKESKESKESKDSQECTYIGINVRRTDYNLLYWTIPYSYYEEAMKLIKQKYGKVKFVVVSDDMKWCRDTFPSDCAFCDRNDVVQFDVLRRMDGWIMSNSSFCWWATYLGDENNNKLVYAPFPWFPSTGKCPDYNEYIYEPHWIKLSVKY